MKKNLLIALICTAFLINITANAAVINDTKKDAGFISLNSSTTKDVDPNIAKVTFAVENTAENAIKASAENNEISNKIINALKTITNVQTDVIKTNNFSIRPVYNTTSSGKRVIKNYTAVNSVTVETKDINKVAKLIDTAIANGANRTDGLTYAFENDKSVCKELYPSLIKELRDQAFSLAQAAGSSLDGIKQINANCVIDSYASNGRFFNAKASGLAMDSAIPEAAPTVVEAGKVKIRVYVNADFYVK